MQTIKFAARRLLDTAVLAIAQFFDRGLDNVIAQFTRMDSQLDRFIARQEAIVDVTAQAASASLRRVDEVKKVEAGFRDRVYAREDAALSGIERARRVRSRLAKLID